MITETCVYLPVSVRLVWVRVQVWPVRAHEDGAVLGSPRKGLYSHKLIFSGTSLIVELGVCLPAQGTRVPSLLQEDPTCQRAAEPVHRNY